MTVIKVDSPPSHGTPPSDIGSSGASMGNTAVSGYATSEPQDDLADSRYRAISRTMSTRPIDRAIATKAWTDIIAAESRFKSANSYGLRDQYTMESSGEDFGRSCKLFDSAIARLTQAGPADWRSLQQSDDPTLKRFAMNMLQQDQQTMNMFIRQQTELAQKKQYVEENLESVRSGEMHGPEKTVLGAGRGGYFVDRGPSSSNWGYGGD